VHGAHAVVRRAGNLPPGNRRILTGVSTPTAPDDHLLLRLEGVSTTFDDPRRGRPVLEDVELVVEAGELVAVIGPSGSGKTTLLAVAAGLERRVRGRVELLGRDLARVSDRELSRLRRRELGLVFQDYHLVDDASLVDNVALAASFAPPGEGPQAAGRARALAVLEQVGLADAAELTPRRLSGGQRQRTALARGLFVSPRLLLADEPTGNLDDATGTVVVELLAEIHAESGTTIVVVTHDERLAAIATRTLRMAAGRLAENHQ
jgi:putative ABC transport system ATP-binding protein